MVTRRTLRRTHLLRPDSVFNQLYTYLLAVLAARYGILVHAVVVMATHEHLILTDLHGRLPRFLQEFHRLVALSVKVLRKWDGAVWDHEKTSVVELRTPHAVIEKLAYVMANPVAAGLVLRARDWPGITTAPSELGRGTRSAARPEHYVDPNNPRWPERVRLELSIPAGLGMADDELRDAVAVELAGLEKAAQREVCVKGRRVAGAHAISRMSPFARARSPEPLRARNPHFAVGRGQRDAFVQAVRVLRNFRREHHEALARWRIGIRDVMFPCGTWLMSWLHGALVARS